MNLRPLSFLCVAYILLIFYASLMPFDLSANRAAVGEHFERAWMCWPFSRGYHASGSDVLSNLLLYVPLGAMLATRWASGRVWASLAAALGATAIGSLISAAVEAGQLLSWERITSAQDWLMNTTGTGFGALWGAATGRRAWAGGADLLRRWRAERPAALAALGICLMLAADALSPYIPTIEVSSVKRNLRNSHFRLEEGLSEHPWHHWMVNRVGVYAVLAALMGASLRRKPSTPEADRRFYRSGGSATWSKAAVIATSVAVICEAAKPFFVGRSINVANVVLAALGAAVGAILGAALGGRLSRRTMLVLAGTLLVGYLTYHQWAPFTFVWDARVIRAKVPRNLEWLPLYHYAMGGRLTDAGLFLRTVLLSGAVAYVGCLGGWPARGSAGRRILSAAAAMGLLGLILETGQFLLPPRTPSVTDVFCYALGGAVGCWAYLRAWRASGTQQAGVSSR